MTKAKVKDLPIDSITPNPDNPRHIEEAVEPVARSIAEFGFLVPIVVNDDNVILSGHTRHAAALSLGMEKVPVIKAVGLSKDQQNAFMLADNRLGENASYDTEKLADILKELTGGDYDATLTGFKVEEIDAFIESSTSELEDILGLGDDDDDDSLESSEEEAGEDVRHLHRLTFLLDTEQKTIIMKAIDDKKKALPGMSNGEAITSICGEA